MPKVRLFSSEVKAAMALMALLAAPALADETIQGDMVVTANRVETASDKIGSAVTVITAQDIERQQAATVADVLRTVPGISIYSFGTTGAQTDVYIRGAESWHTKVIIDGVDMSNVSSTRPSFDFGHLTTADIERIEIVRGPQSLLYGSETIGGVINIITRRGKGKPRVGFNAETGSHHTYSLGSNISGGTGATDYAIGISRLQTDGISSAAERNGNSENDPYKADTLNARLRHRLTEGWSVEGSVRAMNDELYFDRSNSAAKRAEDDDGWFRKRDRAGRIATDFTLFGTVWENKIAFSLQESERDYENGRLAGGAKYYYNGESQKLEYQGALNLAPDHKLVFGAENKVDSTDQNGTNTLMGSADVTNNGTFADYQFSPLDSLFLTLGGRIDDHQTFGTHTTYRATSAYLVEATATRLHGSYGTGFRAPSLMELYLPIYGTKTLMPEESRGWDFGVEQHALGGKAVADVTWFDSRLKDMINTQTIGGVTTFYNLASTRVQGLETSARWQIAPDWRLSGSYTFTDSRNTVTGQILSNRPKHQGSLAATWLPLKGSEITASMRAVGSKFSSTNSRYLGGFAVFNLAASYDVTEQAKVYGRIENLLDKQYQEIDTYGTYGRSAFVGIRTTF